MSVAAISISTAPSVAPAAPKAARAKAFDAVMANAGSAHAAEAASNDDTGARVAAKDDGDDSDTKDTKAERARDAGEDPAALLALAGSVAAIARSDAAPAGAAKAAADRTAATIATAALTLPTTPAAATAPTLQSVSSETSIDSNVLPALIPTMAGQNQPAAKPVKSAPKTVIGVATTSTADILAARAAKIAPVAAMRGSDKDAGDAGSDDGDATATPDPTFAAVASPVTPSLGLAAAATPVAGETLATGGADRQLDLAKGDAWLDGLARDIASSADSNGKLSFQLSPQALGNLHVELTRGDDGTAVKMTTATVDAQAILADAKPRLIESARAHGVHISDATIDLGGAGTSTMGGQRDSSGDGGSSSQQRASAATSDGTMNGQAQSRPQSEPDLYHGAPRQGRIANTSTGGTRQDLDAGYA